MKRFIYRFGYESPVERLQNDEHGTDFESSSAFWVEAESADEALRWGREVSEALVRESFIRSGWSGAIPSWKEDGYAHWIEESPGSEFTADFLDTLPEVKQGEIPSDLTSLMR
jgi:hypothetical protein